MQIGSRVDRVRCDSFASRAFPNTADGTLPPYKTLAPVRSASRSVCGICLRLLISPSMLVPLVPVRECGKRSRFGIACRNPGPGDSPESGHADSRRHPAVDRNLFLPDRTLLAPLRRVQCGPCTHLYKWDLPSC